MAENEVFQWFFGENTTYRFGRFHLTDFHEDWYEHVNPCDGESLRNRILNFFSVKGPLS